jgi:Zn-dependent protease
MRPIVRCHGHEWLSEEDAGRTLRDRRVGETDVESNHGLSLKLGRAFGIGVFVHWTFLVLLAFVFYQCCVVWGRELGVHAVIFILGVFACVTFHEFGHALMARHFGIRTRDITLYPIGGIAHLERMSDSPWQEFWIAVAGPAVNVVIASSLGLGLALLDSEALSREALMQPWTGNLVADLVRANTVLAVLSILPVFPLDGGRALRALLVRPLGRLAATWTAAALGVAFAVLFGIVLMFGIDGLINR